MESPTKGKCHDMAANNMLSPPPGPPPMPPIILPDTAAAHSEQIQHGQVNHVPSMAQMVASNWDAADLVTAFRYSLARIIQEVNKRPSTVDGWAMDIRLKWCQYPVYTFADLPDLPIELVRVLLWDLWRDVLVLKHGFNGWYIEHMSPAGFQPLQIQLPQLAHLNNTSRGDPFPGPGAGMTIASAPGLTNAPAPPTTRTPTAPCDDYEPLNRPQEESMSTIDEGSAGPNLDYGSAGREVDSLEDNEMAEVSQPDTL